MGSKLSVPKPKKLKIGGNSKKGRQSLHNRLTGKYARQFARTAANKRRRRLREERKRQRQ